MLEPVVIVALVAVVGAVVVLLFAVHHRADRTGWLESVSGERLLVHTVDNQTIEGVLFAVLRDGLLLKAPRIVDDVTVNVSGEVWVPREKVALVQRPNGGPR
jgi:hypothetical protein